MPVLWWAEQPELVLGKLLDLAEPAKTKAEWVPESSGERRRFLYLKKEEEMGLTHPHGVLCFYFTSLHPPNFSCYAFMRWRGLVQLRAKNLLLCIHKFFSDLLLLEQKQPQHFPYRYFTGSKLTCTMGMTKDRVLPLPVGAETQMSLGRYPPCPTKYPLDALCRIAGITSAWTEIKRKQTLTTELTGLKPV